MVRSGEGAVARDSVAEVRTNGAGLGFAVFVAALGCSRPTGASGAGPAGASGDSRARQSAAVDDQGACAPAALGFDAAQAITAWRAPTGCAPRGGGVTPTPVRSEDEFSERFACPEGTRSGIDWSRHTLWSTQRSLSPAGAGYLVFAAGARVSLVSRMRSPCPDDPHVMPTPYHLAFLLPREPTPTITESSCALPPRCR